MSDREVSRAQVPASSLDSATSAEQKSSENSTSLTKATDSTYIAPTLIKRAKANPASLTPANILELQRTIGNQAVMRLLGRSNQTETGKINLIQRQVLEQRNAPGSNPEYSIQGKPDEIMDTGPMSDCTSIVIVYDFDEKTQKYKNMRGQHAGGSGVRNFNFDKLFSGIPNDPSTKLFVIFGHKPENKSHALNTWKPLKQALTEAGLTNITQAGYKAARAIVNNSGNIIIVTPHTQEGNLEISDAIKEAEAWVKLIRKTQGQLTEVLNLLRDNPELTKDKERLSSHFIQFNLMPDLKTLMTAKDSLPALLSTCEAYLNNMKTITTEGKKWQANSSANLLLTEIRSNALKADLFGIQRSAKTIEKTIPEKTENKEK